MRLFTKIVDANFAFAGDISIVDRLFENYNSMDQFNKEHVLPLYLCKVTNQDQSIIKFDE